MRGTDGMGRFFLTGRRSIKMLTEESYVVGFHGKPAEILEHVRHLVKPFIYQTLTTCQTLAKSEFGVESR